ncbi:MAG: hypothetical protein AVDCRST_MAG16-2882, partial [uncultured Frankineae bacterium]
ADTGHLDAEPARSAAPPRCGPPPRLAVRQLHAPQPRPAAALHRLRHQPGL